jgi:hypothetical protein
MKSQWQLYKQLELIPDSVPEQPTKRPILTFPLQLAWKLLVDALAKELVYEQQVEYLERCLTQSQTELSLTKLEEAEGLCAEEIPAPDKPYPLIPSRVPSTLHKLWNLME